MYVPSNLREIGEFAQDIVNRCSVSLRQRIERGVVYRNLFLSGESDGTPQIYKKTYAYVDDLASMLYSPVELKFTVAPHGRAGPIDRAMGHAAAAQLNAEMRQTELDEVCDDAVLWALIKGKTFVKLGWSKAGIEPDLVMPEQFGVLEEGKPKLSQQKAFFHRTWITLDDFRDRVAELRLPPRKASALLRAVKQYTLGQPDKEQGDQYAATRMVMLGGLYPYQVSSSPIPSQRSNRGVVDWLTAPQPQLAPQTRIDLVALDEVWAWDSSTEDWVTIQLVGPDCVLTPNSVLLNTFSGYLDPRLPRRLLTADEYQRKQAENPLRGKHPFIEFCLNPSPNYFWGDSEVRLVGSVQEALNARIKGINRVLRKQEDPPRIIAGASINQNAYARLNKAGGYLTDPSPQLKTETLMPQMPQDFYVSLDRYLAMFNDIGGMPEVMRGQGEAGVRSQGHADTLVRMASPRFKDRALRAERSVEAVGGLALDILRNHNPDQQVAWVKEGLAGPYKNHPLDPLLYEPPAPGLFGIVFKYADLPANLRVSVDAHSGSPIFSQDQRALIFALARLQAISPAEVIRLTHPPREEELIEELEEHEAAKAAFLKAHPELLTHGAHGGRRK